MAVRIPEGRAVGGPDGIGLCIAEKGSFRGAVCHLRYSGGHQYCGTSRFKPSIIPKCLRFLVTNVSPSSIAIAATSESKTCRP